MYLVDLVVSVVGKTVEPLFGRFHYPSKQIHIYSVRISAIACVRTNERVSECGMHVLKDRPSYIGKHIRRTLKPIIEISVAAAFVYYKSDAETSPLKPYTAKGFP